MKMHIIQHTTWVEPGEYLAWAERNGYEVTRTRIFRHEKYPDDVTANILIVLGGCQCPATALEECDYFDTAAERAFIRKYIDADKAVVGVCLGSQMVGEAMGAPYEHSPFREIGPVKARLTEAGKADPFLKGFTDVFDAGEWHNDMPGLNDKAVILAESDGCPRQIVRFGKYIYSFQTHMEFTHEIIMNGLEEYGYDLENKGPYIMTREQMEAYDYTDMNRMLSSFLDALMADYVRSHGMEA